jgi:imidazolonepropionase-like amidohydrolase
MRLSTVVLVLAAGLAVMPAPAIAQTETYTVIFGGQRIGHLVARTTGRQTTIEFDYKNNGRGPTLNEVVTTDPEGIPTTWSIRGTTTFGSKVDEQFTRQDNKAEWTDASGTGRADVKEPSIYIPQEASPWSLGLFARALVKTPAGRIAALPGGSLTVEKRDQLTVSGTAAAVRVTAYAVSGINLNPDYVLLDDSGALFAFITPDFVMVRQGYEGDEKALRAAAERLSADRFVAIQKEVAHRYASPVRIRNVRIFDPRTRGLSSPASVVIYGGEITAVESNAPAGSDGIVTIDGGNGTLVPGMFEMHGHLDQQDALLNVAAGITSVRDMGNTNAVLDQLIARIRSGELAGPRVIRSGFIEGKSPFSANNGIVVSSESEAVEAVRWYGARGYWQIKSYNSVNPDWVPAITREAHRLGMRVAGHVPAFATADTVIQQGFDEITHINQFMLGWVLKPGEDTRTLLRLTALKRLQNLDLTSAPVQKTVNALIERKVAIDPTLAIHEELLLRRDGAVPAGAVDYLDHLPIAVQRDAKRARVDLSAPGDEAAYTAAFGKILSTVRMLRERGAFIVFGTDLGGSFTYHRELELYQQAGMTAAEILARATLDMARYVGQDQRLGSIEKGKLADFFLVPGDPTQDLRAIKKISMVVKDGVVYFPAEIYPKFGIRPFVEAPAVTLPQGSSSDVR